MPFPLIDLHCDTATELFRTKQSLTENRLAVSLRGASVFPSYLQVMAFFTAPELSDEDGWERFLSVRADLLRDPAVTEGRAKCLTALGEELPVKEFITYMGMQCLMGLEIASICFAISSIFSKTKTGLALGTSLMLYAFDIIGRVVQSVGDYLFIGPFSYSNASDIFSNADTPFKAIVFGIALAVASAVFAFVYYNKRDLAS